MPATSVVAAYCTDCNFDVDLKSPMRSPLFWSNFEPTKARMTDFSWWTDTYFVILLIWNKCSQTELHVMFTCHSSFMCCSHVTAVFLILSTALTEPPLIFTLLIEAFFRLFLLPIMMKRGSLLDHKDLYWWMNWMSKRTVFANHD